MTHRYDLILQGGRAFDPGRSFDRVSDVGVKDGRIVTIASKIPAGEARQVINVDGLLVAPGLIDMHTHCFKHHDIEWLDPDAIGVRGGVTSVVEMGSSGPYTFEALKRWVIDRAETTVYAMVSAQSMGGYVQGHTVPDIVSPTMIDEETAIRVIEAHPNIIRGIKVQGNAPSYARWKTTLMDKVKRISRAAKVPAYLHTGQPEPKNGVWVGGVYSADPLADIGGSVDNVLPRMLELLDPGDVLGHVFYYCGSITNSKGQLLTGVREAVDRGIRLDVAHGWHFSLTMARMVLEQGIVPDVISSDQHRDYQIPGQPTPSNNSLQLVMSKLLAVGLTLQQVIAMTTTNPAEILKISDHSGRLDEGRIADISVLAVQSGNWKYRDLQGTVADGKQRIVPVITLKNGRIHQNNPALLPDLESIQDVDDIAGRTVGH